MQRSICTPFIPALNTAARSYRYTHTAPPAPPPAPLIANAVQTSEFQQSVGAMQNKLFKRKLPPQEFYNLSSVHNIMQLYRACRGQKEPANVSDLIHAILTTLQMRRNVLKPLISNVRDQIIKKQNEEVNAFLNEIVDDIIDSRSFTSRTGLVYLLTAFDMTGCTSLSSTTWRRLHASPSEQLRNELSDPRVVSAALKYADPESMSLEELEKTYTKTVEEHGRSLEAEEALIVGYLRFREFGKVVGHYSRMIEFYDVSENEQVFTRINNQILTVCNVYAFSKPLFNSTISENSEIQLHPTAAARFITLTYMSTEDIELTVDVYLKALEKLKTQSFQYPPFSTRIMVSEVLKTISMKYIYDGPVPEARALLDKILNSGLNKSHSNLILNQTVSVVAKKWPESDLILELQKRYPENVQFDSLRVLLTSSAGLPASEVPTAKVAEWWAALCAEKEAQTFEWLALIKACNEPTRVEFLKQEITNKKPNLDAIYLDPRAFGEYVLPVLSELGYTISPTPPEEKKYTDDMLYEEFAVCSANANNAPYFHPTDKYMRQHDENGQVRFQKRTNNRYRPSNRAPNGASNRPSNRTSNRAPNRTPNRTSNGQTNGQTNEQSNAESNGQSSEQSD